MYFYSHGPFLVVYIYILELLFAAMIRFLFMYTYIGIAFIAGIIVLCTIFPIVR